jgi:riboflavin kinase/FMN adenylyltransferase
VSAVAIGVFDGVHLGHQALLQRTVETARELKCRAAVLTFHPHPACVVAPERAPRLLYPVGERREMLEAHGIDEVRMIAFDKFVAQMTPEEFASETLRGCGRSS